MIPHQCAVFQYITLFPITASIWSLVKFIPQIIPDGHFCYLCVYSWLSMLVVEVGQAISEAPKYKCLYYMGSSEKVTSDIIFV